MIQPTTLMIKGQIVLGLQEINGDFYYFRPENTYKQYDIGEMLRDRFIYENNKVYYVDHSGKVLKKSLFECNGRWHYFTKDGTAATGEVEINGQNYTLISLGFSDQRKGC